MFLYSLIVGFFDTSCVCRVPYILQEPNEVVLSSMWSLLLIISLYSFRYEGTACDRNIDLEESSVDVGSASLQDDTED